MTCPTFALVAALALAACADAPAGDRPDAVSATDGAVADSGALAPRLVESVHGPFLTWVEPDGDGHALRFARWTGDGWNDASTVDRGDDWFVNWADTPGAFPYSDDATFAHTLRRRGGHAYDIVVRLDGPDGRGDPFVLHTDGREAEHGFVSAVPFEGGVAVVWLDGREQAGGHGHGGDMTLRAVVLDSDGTRRGETVLDARTCDCCPTALARTRDGLVAAYRDRSPGEIRDVAVVRYADGAWTEPTIPHADGWEIAGCPVNGPALASRGDRAALAWYTEADVPRVRLSISDDGGETWAEPVRIDGGAPIGRVDVTLLDDGSPVVSWLERVSEGAEVRVRRLGAAAPVTVAAVPSGRESGIPQIAALFDPASELSVLVAWTDAAAGTVRSALVAP